MESVAASNGIAKSETFIGALLEQNSGLTVGLRLTVQQALGKWYSLINQNDFSSPSLLFDELPQQEFIYGLQTDIELLPSVLMDEMISSSLVYNKEQYLKLVQAQLVNLSDSLLSKDEPFSNICVQIESCLQFLQNFFYQYFDTDSRLPKYSIQQFCDCATLKLEYWKIRLNQSELIDALESCLHEQSSYFENNISYRKLDYLKFLFKEIESATTILTEDYVRQLFIYNNFNSACFINYEIELIKAKVSQSQTYTETISLLNTELSWIVQLKVKPVICFDANLPSVKKQLTDWITDEIKQAEIKNNKATDKDLLIDPESKIQTSLSVAKLAVLIRLLVADKIIINKSIAPMLRTVTKLFTTLQKDEISFGSLETKYHAPDKNTINMMKEMLQKWVGIVGKL